MIILKFKIKKKIKLYNKFRSKDHEILNQW